MAPPPDWLRHPFAHRGLHDAAAGIVENTASAVQAAIDAGYGIEVDLRLARCGTVMVFHDRDLSRLTVGEGEAADLTAAELAAIPFRQGRDRMLTLTGLLELVAGRVPMLLEVKGERRDDPRLVEAIVQTLAGYRGPFAVMSFDPRIVARFRRRAPHFVRGIVAESFRHVVVVPGLAWHKRLRLHLLYGLLATRPAFIAYDIRGIA